MKLVKPSIEIMSGLQSSGETYMFIELCARNCYKSEEKITCGSAETLIKKLIKRKHWTPFEFWDVTVRFICDRGISHELVRHRLCSFLQESSRYCDYGDGEVCFVIPYFCKNITPGIYTGDNPGSNDWTDVEMEWFNAVIVAEEYYQMLRQRELEPQGARDVLPNSLKTEVICKANLREWMHIFKLRCNQAAHPDMVKLMLDVKAKFNEALPIIFNEEVHDA